MHRARGPRLHAVGDIDLAREAELISYDVINRPVLEPLRGLVRLAADLMGVRMAEINAVSHDHVIHLATSEDGLGSVPAEHSICSRAVLRDERTLVVHDARQDPTFAVSPYVDGRIESVTFYAGTQLVTPRGVAIGTMCVWHDQPRDFSEHEQRTLESLAEVVVSILELHRDSLHAAHSLQRLADSHREIALSNESLEAFAGQVGHDLRTPLAALKLALSLLADESEPLTPADAATMLRRGLSIATRMEHGLNDLIDFAVLGGGVVLEKVDVAEVTLEVLEDLSAATSTSRIEVDSDSLPVVTAYRGHVHAILQNLLGNAVKYAGGAGAAVRVSGSVGDGRGRVMVSDAGPGVPVELQDRVFDLAVRGDHPTHEGYGIGLATCSRLVHVMGGEIGVEETAGGGASFWFELPLPTT